MIHFNLKMIHFNLKMMLPKYHYIVLILLSFEFLVNSIPNEYCDSKNQIEIVKVINIGPIKYFGLKNFKENKFFYRLYYGSKKEFGKSDVSEAGLEMIGALYNDDYRCNQTSCEFPKGFQLIKRQTNNRMDYSYYVYQCSYAIYKLNEKPRLKFLSVKSLNSDKNVIFLKGSTGILNRQNSTTMFIKMGMLQAKSNKTILTLLNQPKISSVFSWNDQLYAIDEKNYNKLYKLNCQVNCSIENVSYSIELISL